VRLRGSPSGSNRPGLSYRCRARTDSCMTLMHGGASARGFSARNTWPASGNMRPLTSMREWIAVGASGRHCHEGLA
jgi:hypothetical protein